VGWANQSCLPVGASFYQYLQQSWVKPSGCIQLYNWRSLASLSLDTFLTYSQRSSKLFLFILQISWAWCHNATVMHIFSVVCCFNLTVYCSNLDSSDVVYVLMHSFTVYYCEPYNLVATANYFADAIFVHCTYCYSVSNANNCWYHCALFYSVTSYCTIISRMQFSFIVHIATV
jgi:hypothetical protein